MATSLTPVESAAGTVTAVFAIGLPFALLVVTVWWAITHALHPVEGIRRQASAIGGANLTERVPVPRSRNEIARRAATVNEMLDRLEDAAPRQNQFIGDASHGLRSRLAVLRAQVEVTLAHPEPAEATRVLALVQDQSARMTTLAEDLLYLARSTEPGAMVLPVAVGLDELFLAELRRSRSSGNLTVTVIALDAARVIGSLRDLARALRNLPDNARNHTRSEVRLALRTANSVAEITVSDDGEGIAAADRERLFECLSRLEESRHTTSLAADSASAWPSPVRPHWPKAALSPRATGPTGSTVPSPCCAFRWSHRWPSEHRRHGGVSAIRTAARRAPAGGTAG